MLAGLVAGAHGTQDAIANGDTRTITILHTHTKESAAITFRKNGRYDPQALEQLNWLLRDWRMDEPIKMDPRLFDIVWEVYREVGASEPIHVVSAYRSPQTNSMLRRRSRAVAKHSQHMLGKAMDFYLPEVPVDRIRGIGVRLQHGGVGYYPTAFNPFIHLDAGSVRAWPRLTCDQLARIFPDGRTVHIPADGTPLPGYEEAKAEVLARGGSVQGETGVAEAEEGAGAPTRRRSLWATLFGSSEDEDKEYYAAQSGSGGPGRLASRAIAPTVAAYAPGGNSEDGGSRGFFARAAAPEPERASPAQRLARPATRVAALSAPAEAAPMPQPSPALRPDEGPLLPAGADRTRTASIQPTASQAAAAAASQAGADPAPRFQWQQGPAGQRGIAPGGIAPGGITPGSLNPDADGQGEPDQRAAMVPVPPRRPGDETAAASVAGAPLPPLRPVALAAAGIMPLQRADLSGAGLGDMAIPLAGMPMPPTRPGALARSEPSVDPAPRSTPSPAGDERTALRALFGQATSNAAPKAQAQVKVAAARAKPQAPPAGVAAGIAPDGGPTLNLGFSSKPTGDLSPTRFTGPAVKPLPILR